MVTENNEAKKQYDVIFSLGVNCACAQYLRDYRLRVKSGPLDWVISEDLYAPFKTLLDEFKVFTDFSYLSIQKSEENSSNLTYLHTKNKYSLSHDFFKNTSFEEQTEEVKKKYLRRINRLYDDLNSSKDILFCWYGETGRILDKKEILFYIKEIRNKYKANINFLFISYSDIDKPAKQEPEQGVYLYDLPKIYLVGKNSNLNWDKQHIGPILSSIKLKSNKQLILFKIKRAFYRILGSFILDEVKRRRFRKKHE
ncbi:MAG: hypothetical protein J5594_05145 [Elusimicrobiaceae bacterium]|nr:hypothetical protein [Elusimicrobiaceae bacterium]